MSDLQNTHGTPGADEEADTASGGAPEQSSAHTEEGADGTGAKSTDEILEDETTDDDGKPLENPSGG